MTVSAKQLKANRANALKSTGPRTTEGKVAVSRNATRHGILSQRLLLDDERPEDVQLLLATLIEDLKPVGMLELTLVERIAITLWRQRRLVTAETAAIAANRNPRYLAQDVSDAIGVSRYSADAIQARDLEPSDPEQDSWCRQVISEYERRMDLAKADLTKEAPLIHAQLGQEAESEDTTVPEYLRECGGIQAYLHELIGYCRNELKKVADRPRLLALADQASAVRLLPPQGDLIQKYQTTLDSQLYKALWALRETQEWRRSRLEGEIEALQNNSEAA